MCSAAAIWLPPPWAVGGACYSFGKSFSVAFLQHMKTSPHFLVCGVTALWQRSLLCAWAAGNWWEDTRKLCLERCCALANWKFCMCLHAPNMRSCSQPGTVRNFKGQQAHKQAHTAGFFALALWAVVFAAVIWCQNVLLPQQFRIVTLHFALWIYAAGGFRTWWWCWFHFCQLLIVFGVTHLKQIKLSASSAPCGLHFIYIFIWYLYLYISFCFRIFRKLFYISI